AHARDKDAVSASLLAAEMAAYHKANGRTLVDALNLLYEKYGYYLDALETAVLKGKEGAEKIKKSMEAFREKGAAMFDEAVTVTDYLDGVGDIPKDNVLRFDFADGSWAAARPSGTEPKLKMYFSVKGADKEEAALRQGRIRAAFFNYIDN
ncbi:MAG: phospho-sugar mutase, partial [Clostridia bacterium]|nr:phospho-sugar mutase [Clostridia bacterium]